jgi:sucrose-6-phosphate hydrolase SacC (GH32 family)
LKFGKLSIAVFLLIFVTVVAFVMLISPRFSYDDIRVYNDVNSPPDPPWLRLGVILDHGESGSFDDKGIESPLIVKKNDGTYVMIYRGQSSADKTGRIMRATSTNGKTWTKTGVVMIPTEKYEGDKIDPMAFMYENGIYKLWYGGDTGGGCACYATSTDSINWQKYIGNPVLAKTIGSWDNEGAGGQNTVFKTGSTYKMYYKGYGKDSPGWTFYGLAESNDGVIWIKKGKQIIPDQEIGETTTFRNLYAFKIDDSYYLLHTMVNYLSLYLLQSNDGVTWQNKGLFFRHGLAPGGLDAKWATSPCLVVEGDTIKMWYEGGNPYGQVRVCYAEIAKKDFISFARLTKIEP